MQFYFVSTRRGSQFMTELLSAVSVATAAAGHSVELVFDEFPPLRDECIYIVIPHEFHAWGNPRGLPDARQCERTIALCTENPGTPWFEETYQLVPQFAAAVSINRSSAAELQRRGIRCEHLQLGYSPLWDSWLRDGSVERDIDVLYLGAADSRRDPLLAGLGGELWARRCQFLVPPLEPRIRARPDFLKGVEKYQRLRSAKILINLHRTTSSALEWMRFLEAICNGCVVVSEPSRDGDPLVAGEHFVAASVEELAPAVDRLLDQPDRLRLMRERAYDFVREQLPMEPGGRRLAELAAELPRHPPGRDASLSSPVAAQSPATRRPPGSQPSDDDSSAHATTRLSLFRSISSRMAGGRHRDLQTIRQTPAYVQAEPRVTVILLNTHERRPETEALASVAASHYDALELLILADAASGLSASAVGSFLDGHPTLPATLLRQSVDQGLGHSLNSLVGRARGEYLFTLDATGGIYPSTLKRLVETLDANPRAVFAYPMVAAFEQDQPVDLLSSLPWEPERLERGSWIDPMVLIRRTRLLELGGYSTDPALAGWESFELWCRCAEAGGHGVHVAQVLAWRQRTGSAATLGGESGTPAKWALMRERFPRVLAPPEA
jgi:hypothetical protein